MEMNASSLSVQIKTGIFLELWGKERISGARLKHKLGINSRNKQTIERSIGSTGNAFCQGQNYHPKNRE